MQGGPPNFDIVLTATNGTAERIDTLERGNTNFQGWHAAPNSVILKNLLRFGLDRIQMFEKANVDMQGEVLCFFLLDL
jgi:hypothetical protein